MKRFVWGATAVATAAAVTAVAGATTASARNPAAGAHGDGGHGDGRHGYVRVRSELPHSAVRFRVASPDLRDGGVFPADTWADAFGCSGDNRQVRLSWSGAPSGTRSYAVSMFDVDAPTGSGFWHWLVWDIPAGSSRLGPALPAGAVAGTYDAGASHYTGPCPAVGDIAHRYRITVYALDVPDLGLDAATPASVTAVTLSGHIIGYAQLTASARR
jgi:Raf kinase inhibitor-like YbhB/YbcL family protein